MADKKTKKQEKHAPGDGPVKFVKVPIPAKRRPGKRKPGPHNRS